MKSNTMKLYKYLKRYHTGMEKAIIAKHIRRTKTFRKKDIYYLVSVLRKAGIPICSCCKGYFFPHSYTEISENVARFDRYRSTLKITQNLLDNARISA